MYCCSLAYSFYGFCIDVLERISKIIGFNYILDLVQDRKVSFRISIFLKWKFIDGTFSSVWKYGAKDATTGEWNGEIYENCFPSIATKLIEFLQFRDGWSLDEACEIILFYLTQII